MTQTEKEALLEEALYLEATAYDLLSVWDVSEEEKHEIREQAADLYRTAAKLRAEAQA